MSIKQKHVPGPSEADKRGGWSFSFEFVQEVARKLESIDMDDVDEVLRVLLDEGYISVSD